MSLKKLSKLLLGPRTASHRVERYPLLQEALEKHRDAIQNDDLLALRFAIDQCFVPTRRGFSFEDAELNPKLEPQLVCEVPAWVLGAVSMLLWSGISGQWPATRGAGAPSRRTLSAQVDLWRTWHVIKARESGVAWDSVLEFVAEKAKGRAGSVHAIDRSYCRVVKNLNSDPEYYRRLTSISPRLLDAAVYPPFRD